MKVRGCGVFSSQQYGMVHSLQAVDDFLSECRDGYIVKQPAIQRPVMLHDGIKRV